KQAPAWPWLPKARSPLFLQTSGKKIVSQLSAHHVIPPERGTLGNEDLAKECGLPYELIRALLLNSYALAKRNHIEAIDALVLQNQEFLYVQCNDLWTIQFEMFQVNQEIF